MQLLWTQIRQRLQEQVGKEQCVDVKFDLAEISGKYSRVTGQTHLTVRAWYPLIAATRVLTLSAVWGLGVWFSLIIKFLASINICCFIKMNSIILIILIFEFIFGLIFTLLLFSDHYKIGHYPIQYLFYNRYQL